MLTAREREVWQRVGRSLPPGMLRMPDEYILTAFCRAVAIADEAAALLRSPPKWAHELKEGETRPQPDPPLLAETPNGFLQPHAYLSIMNKQAVLIATLGAQLGLSPAARARIAVPDDNSRQDDPNAHYFA